MCNFLQNEGEVAIFDATNTTRERRRIIYNYCTETYGFRVFFVESICDSLEVIQANIREVKLNCPDYKDVSEAEAFNDFLSRIELYKKQYEPIDDEVEEKHYSFIKIYNCGERFLVNKIVGNKFQHGESEMNVQQRIGGNSQLSPAGKEVLIAIVIRYSPLIIHIYFFIIVYRSSCQIHRERQMQQAIQTAEKLNVPKEQWKALNGINAGIFEGLTYQEVAESYPEQFAARNRSKYYYRYPGGESYHDLLARLEPVIMELERAANVLVITHQAVIRCILAYFLDTDPERLPYLKIPLHTVMKLTPMAYGCMMECIPLSVEANSEYNRAVVETLNEFLEVHSEIKVSPAITQTVYQDAGIASETIDVNGNQTPLMDTTIVDITLNNSLSSIQDSTI
ncbi:unnamed protein product [Rotaria sp. Silwood1]|nr:unnamed protein product [Rotaria sp. Silwood1]